MEIVQPRVARNELPWGGWSNVSYPERVASQWQDAHGGTAEIHPRPLKFQIFNFPSRLLLLLLLGSVGASASPSSALREYNSGHYDQSLQEYEHLLEKKADDPRLRYNAGAAAYRSQKFDEAAKQFTNVLAAPDLKLQQRAYYNLGNSLYRIGEKSADSGRKKDYWENALKTLEIAVKLDSQDQDAKFNRDFVKKKLEELQKQQEQNQDNNTEPSEDAKRAKAQADEAVMRREYARALKIMDDQLTKDPTTAYYNTFIERLKEVNGVQQNAEASRH
jgi:tetratricopeptide (TPR) repeat protein